MGTQDRPIVRFRHHPAWAVAGLIVTISTTTLASVSGWLALLVLAPLAGTVWLWRAGTDVTGDRIRVRALFGQVTIPWTAVHELAPAGPDRTVARLTSGTTVRLTAVTPADLPSMASAAGRGPVEETAWR